MAGSARQTKQRLGEILVEQGLVTGAQIQHALERQKTTGELLGEALVKLKFVKEPDIVGALVKQLGCPYLDASKYYISKEALALVPVEAALEHRLIPLDRIGPFLLLAVSGDVPADVLEEIERRTSLTISLYVSTPQQIVKAVKKNADRLVRKIQHDARTTPLEQEDGLPSPAPAALPCAEAPAPVAPAHPLVP